MIVVNVANKHIFEVVPFDSKRGFHLCCSSKTSLVNPAVSICDVCLSRFLDFSVDCCEILFGSYRKHPVRQF